jgi:hypothetical protein
MYNAYYTSDKEINDSGDEVKGIGFDLKIYAFVNRVIWVSNLEILGGNFFADALVPLIYTDIQVDAAGIDSSKFGVGDPYVEPFGIAWHGPRYDAAFGASVYIPVGEYDKHDPASPGQDLWTFMFTGGGTLYLDESRTWSASLLARYEIHTEKQDLDYTPGNDFHFEWGIGKVLTPNIEAGVAGYAEWQVTDDSGDGGSDDKNRVFAAGPEINFMFPEQMFFVSLRAEWEFEARNQQEGMIGVLTLTKGF